MTAKEIQKRSERAQQLRVLQVSDTIFFVESAEGKIKEAATNGRIRAIRLYLWMTLME